MDQITYMISHFSPKQDELAKEVRKKMKPVSVFECEGALFEGNPYHVAIQFAHDNPTGGDFYVWVQKNYRMIMIKGRPA